MNFLESEIAPCLGAVYGAINGAIKGTIFGTISIPMRMCVSALER